jgi:hypothetical protein
MASSTQAGLVEGPSPGMQGPRMQRKIVSMFASSEYPVPAQRLVARQVSAGMKEASKQLAWRRPNHRHAKLAVPARRHPGAPILYLPMVLSSFGCISVCQTLSGGNACSTSWLAAFRTFCWSAFCALLFRLTLQHATSDTLQNSTQCFNSYFGPLVYRLASVAGQHISSMPSAEACHGHQGFWCNRSSTAKYIYIYINLKSSNSGVIQFVRLANNSTARSTLEPCVCCRHRSR